MKLFRCDHCGQTLYFENVVCEHCGHRLGYEPEGNALVSLEPHDHDGSWLAPHLPGKASQSPDASSPSDNFPGRGRG